MKKILNNKKIYGLPAMALAIVGMASCSNELNEPSGGVTLPDGTPVITPVKAPEFTAWSGSQVLGNNTRSSSSYSFDKSGNNGDIWNGHDLQSKVEAPSNISDEERRGVLAKIDEKTNGERISEDIVLPWVNYWLQDVVSGQNGSFEGAGSNGTSSSSYVFEAFNKDADCSPYYHHGEDYADYSEVTNSAHINSYFQTLDNERINETALMTNMQNGTYEEMKGKQFRWFINCHENLHWSEYIFVEYEDSYYICFDFACGHAENDKDGHPGKGAEHNDWDYNDWIIKISPAIPTEGEIPDFPVWTGDHIQVPVEPGDKDEENDDKDKEDDNNGGDQPDNNKPAVHPDSEVEVNLSINDDLNQGFVGLVTKLSIHVRQAGDVEIFIPVDASYYCPQDDLAILESHTGGFAYGGESVNYNIGNSNVTLTVTFEENGIRVTTGGITEEVFNHCVSTNGDGINFEIYNYFNQTISRDLLKEMLDDTEIEFKNNELPDFYINAFNKTATGEKFDEDCTVSIVESQKEYFDGGITGNHLNASPYNEIFTNLNYKGEAGEHDHLFLWGTGKSQN